MNKIEEYINIDENLLSKGEKQLHKFVRENISQLSDMTIYEFAEATLTSRATIDRYLKKLGISGYKQFKAILANIENELSDNLEIELLSNYLNSNKQLNIAVVGSGSAYIASEYLTRRMQTLGYFAHSYTFDSVMLLHNSVDIMIIISSTGSLRSRVTEEVIKEYKGIAYAITATDSNLAKRVDHVISNGKNNTQSKYERENMLSTFRIIEMIFDRLIKLG